MKVTLSYGRLYYKDTCDNKINRIFNYAIRPHRNPGPLLNNADKGWTETTSNWYLLNIGRSFSTIDGTPYASQLVVCFNLSCLWLPLLFLVLVEFLIGSQGFQACSQPVCEGPSLLQLWPNLGVKGGRVIILVASGLLGQEEQLVGQGMSGSHVLL